MYVLTKSITTLTGNPNFWNSISSLYISLQACDEQIPPQSTAMCSNFARKGMIILPSRKCYVVKIWMLCVWCLRTNVCNIYIQECNYCGPVCKLLWLATLVCVQSSMAGGAQTAVGWSLMMVQQHTVCVHSLDTLVFFLWVKCTILYHAVFRLYIKHAAFVAVAYFVTCSYGLIRMT